MKLKTPGGCVERMCRWQRIVLLVLIVVGCGPSSAPKPPVSPLPPDASTQSLALAASPPQPRKFTPGEALYIRHCSDCHGWEGQGNGPLASLLEVQPPPLRRADLFSRYTESELVARVLFGKDLGAPTTSSAVLNTEAEVAALWTHMQRLPTIPWEQVAKGQEVYDSLCVSCHGVYGRGDGPLMPALPSHPRDLSNPSYQKQVSNEELVRIISEGKGAMPGAAEVLKPEELQTVAVFVRVLSPGYELYDRFCAVCHGPDGRPLALAFQTDEFTVTESSDGMPTFDQEYFQTHTFEQVRPWLTHMLNENRVTMPHFAGELSADEVRQILTYLRSLSLTS